MNIVRIYLKEGVQSPKAFICSTYESYARIFTHTYFVHIWIRQIRQRDISQYQGQYNAYLIDGIKTIFDLFLSLDNNYVKTYFNKKSQFV